jgi:curved DNA-binding protein CbpA
MSLYKVLGVEKSADDDEIRIAYKQAVIKAHPDKPGGTPQKFKQVQTAYETLKSRDSRREYDEKITAAKKLRMFAMHRPEPLDTVKAPAYYKLLDGTVYAFETAPDKLKCKFRFGDVVSFGKETGCFIGLSSNGFYWTRDGTDVATFLCCSGMGSERDIELQFRANLNRAGRTTGMARTSSFSARADPLAQSGGSSTFSSTQSSSSPTLDRQQETQKRREVLERERIRDITLKLRKVMLEEQRARSSIREAVFSCLVQLAEIHRAFLRDVDGRVLSPVKDLSGEASRRPPPLTMTAVLSDPGMAPAPRIPFSPVFQSASAPNLRLDRMQPIMIIKKKLSPPPSLTATSTPVKKPNETASHSSPSAPPAAARRHSVGASVRGGPTVSTTTLSSSTKMGEGQRRASLGASSSSFGSAPPSPSIAVSSARLGSSRFQAAFSLNEGARSTAVPSSPSKERKVTQAPVPQTTRSLTPSSRSTAMMGSKDQSHVVAPRSMTPNSRAFR